MDMATGEKEALIGNGDERVAVSMTLESFVNNGIYIPNGALNGHHLCGELSSIKKRNERGKVCILSIDGGGVRGIIPAKLLAHLERIIQLKTGDPSARVVDFFDIVAGTNMGGVISTMLVTESSECAGRPLFSAQEMLDCICSNAASIFKPRARNEEQEAAVKKASRGTLGFLKQIFSMKSKGKAAANTSSCARPKLRMDGLESLLSSIFGARTLRHTLKPLLVPCYDLSSAAPFLFSRAGALDSPAWDFQLLDVCRAACATPGLFPPVNVVSSDGTTRCSGVDAGLVMNNPASSVMTHVLHNKEEFPGVNGFDDVLLLSLGTGVSQRSLQHEEVTNWGVCQWSRPITDIVVDHVSDMVDQMLALACYSSTMRHNYLRLQTLMQSGAEMDDASDSNVRRLTSMAEQLLNERAMEHMGFGGMRLLMETNAQRLDWFAEQLVQEHKARSARSIPTVVLKKPRPGSGNFLAGL